MLGPEIRTRVASPEFRPFTLVMANGERITVRHRDSIGMPSVETKGVRIFAPYIIVLETRDDAVIEHSLALGLIMKIEDTLPLNGMNGVNGKH